MRKSRWIISSNYSIGKKSKRFIVEIDDSKFELAAASYELLVLHGDGAISSEALMLALEEDVNVVIIDNDFSLSWFSGFVKGVEYLLSQKSFAKLPDHPNAIIDTYILSGCNFLSEVGYQVDKELVEYLLSIDDIERKFLEVFSRFESITLNLLSVELGLDTSIIRKLCSLYSAFLEAEVLSAIIFSGLSPVIGFLNKRMLYRDLSLEFKFPIVWKSVLNLRDEQIKDLDSMENKRRVLRVLKGRMEEVSSYYKVSYRELIRRRARLLASSMINPAIRYPATEWF